MSTVSNEPQVLSYADQTATKTILTPPETQRPTVIDVMISLLGKADGIDEVRKAHALYDLQAYQLATQNYVVNERADRQRANNGNQRILRDISTEAIIDDYLLEHDSRSYLHVGLNYIQGPSERNAEYGRAKNPEMQSLKLV
jgi:hypothetical protein